MSVLDRHGSTVDSDEVLAGRIRDGDRRAFAVLYERYHRRIYGFALKFAKSDVLAEEAVQEVFVSLWERRQCLAADHSPKPYLFTICKNHLLNVLSRAGREEPLKEEILQSAGPQARRADDASIYNDYLDIARDAIESLPPRRRQVFELCRTEGRSYREVAQALEISSGTVSDHMVKANRHLKDYLSRHTDLTFDVLSTLAGLLSIAGVMG